MAAIGHWTNTSIQDFLYRVGSDYIAQIEQAMDDSQVSQAALAQRLSVSEGRVSQVLNNPGNLTLKAIIAYARALKKKVAIVAYDDQDPENNNGPINSQVFAECWEKAGRPSDFLGLEARADVGIAANHLEQAAKVGVWSGRKDMAIAQSVGKPLMLKQQSANTMRAPNV